MILTNVQYKSVYFIKIKTRINLVILKKLLIYFYQCSNSLFTMISPRFVFILSTRNSDYCTYFVYHKIQHTLEFKGKQQIVLA